MPFKTTREVQYDGKTIAAGRPITFTDDADGEDARDQLLNLDPPAIIGAEAKPLERMSKPELQQVGDDEGVAFPDNPTQAQMVDAIKAKRAGAAQPPQTPQA